MLYKKRVSDWNTFECTSGRQQMKRKKEDKKTSLSNQINQVRCCVSFIGVEQCMGLSLSVCYKPFSA